MEMVHARLPSTASLAPFDFEYASITRSRADRTIKRSLYLGVLYNDEHALLTYSTAEFRGPGTHHHHFEDDVDDYDMDMEQRTRFIGGRANRIILLGDGTEISIGRAHDDDGDIDMEDRGEAEEAEDEDDLEGQVQRDARESHESNGTKDEAPALDSVAASSANENSTSDSDSQSSKTTASTGSASQAKE